MGLIQYEQIEDGFSATANLWNSRYAKVYDLVNGNLDSQNLKNNAVTEAKIASGAVTSSKLGAKSVLPSKVGNTWIGKSSGGTNVGTTWQTRFNKTITLEESSYLYVFYQAAGNSNLTSGSPQVRIMVNDSVLTQATGIGGLELFTAKKDADFPFGFSAITPDKQSGDVNVKVQVSHTNSNGWDCGEGFVRIDALGDDTFLG